MIITEASYPKESKSMSRIDTLVFNSLSEDEKTAITSFLTTARKASADAQQRVAQQMRSAQIDKRSMTIGGVALSNSAVSYIASALGAE
jgi:hypothetical protein